MRSRLLGLLAIACGACTTTIDPQTPRPYPCSPDGGSALQCPGGWHCGVEGLCHDPTIGYPYQCASNADCAHGWRCGLNHICHDQDAGFAYACLSDIDCERGWRCDAEGSCVDSVADGLLADAGAPSFQFTRVSPQASGLPTDISASHPFVGTLAYQVKMQFFARLSNGVITHTAYFPEAYLDFASNTFALASAVTVPAPGAKAIATSDAGTFFVDGVGLAQVTWSLDGGSVRRLPQIDGGDALRLSTDDNSLLVVFSRDEFSLYNTVSGRTQTHLYLPASDGGHQRIWDMAASSSANVPGGQLWLMAAGDEGLAWVLRNGNDDLLLPDGGSGAYASLWQPAPYPFFPNVQCGGGTDAGSLRAVAIYRGIEPSLDSFTVLALPWNVDPANAQSFQPVVASLYNQIPYSPFTSCSYSSNIEIAGPCTPCPDAGYRVAEVEADGQLAMIGCVTPDGQHKETYLIPSGPPTGCGTLALSNFAQYEEVSVQGRSQSNATLLAGARGQTWWSDSSQFYPLTMDVAPEVLFTEGPFLTGYSATANNHYYFASPGVGMVTGQFTPVFDQLGGSIDGTSWVLTLDAGVPDAIHAPSADPTHAVARVPGLTDLFPPFHGTVATSADGGTQLVVTIFDKVLSAPVVGLKSDTELAVENVPLAFSPIESLTTPPYPPSLPDGGQPWLSGYLLTRNSLFSFSASTPQLWSSQEIALPRNDWTRVWHEGTRARIGFQDGTVYSLPSRVPIAPPFGLNETVTDFAGVCNATYALTNLGLYRLAPSSSGSPVGQWVAESFGGSFTPGFPPGLAQGKLVLEGQDLLVVTSQGEVVRGTLNPPCPP